MNVNYTCQSLAKAFTSLDHRDFHMKVVPSVFDYTDTQYLESLIMFAVPFAALGLLVFLGFLLGLLCRCCRRRNPALAAFMADKERTDYVSRASITCLLFAILFLVTAICATGLMTIGFGAVEDNLNTADGYVGGINDDLGDVLSSTSGAQNATLDFEAQGQANFTAQVQQAVTDLLDALDTATSDTKTAQAQLAGVTPGEWADQVSKVDRIRLIVTVTILAVLLVLAVVSIVGVCCRSHGTAVGMVWLGLLASLFVWTAVGVFFAATVAASDVCCDPYAPIETALASSSSDVRATANYYLFCGNPVYEENPLANDIALAQQQINASLSNAPLLVDWANSTRPDLLPLVATIEGSLVNTSTTLTSLNSTLECSFLNSLFISSLSSVCGSTATLLDLLLSSLTLLVFAVLWIGSLMLLVALWKHYEYIGAYERIGAFTDPLGDDGIYCDPSDRLRLVAARSQQYDPDADYDVASPSLSHRTASRQWTMPAEASDDALGLVPTSQQALLHAQNSQSPQVGRRYGTLEW